MRDPCVIQPVHNQTPTAFSAPTARPKVAQGNALGRVTKSKQALKGRPNLCRHPSPPCPPYLRYRARFLPPLHLCHSRRFGPHRLARPFRAQLSFRPIPRALPWAVIGRAFGAMNPNLNGLNAWPKAGLAVSRTQTSPNPCVTQPVHNQKPTAFSAPTARPKVAQGNALGRVTNSKQALKGRPNLCRHPSPPCPPYHRYPVRFLPPLQDSIAFPSHPQGVTDERRDTSKAFPKPAQRNALDRMTKSKQA
jgi:hypothetical protein